VLALALVTIMAGLVIMVFIAVSGERRAADTRLRGLGASQLAASAPQLVIAQLADAAASGEVWASQPGMLRTFTATGGASGVYKLYSARRLFAAAADFPETEDAPPADWKTGLNRALFCDLNEPVPAASGALLYPVADPAAAADGFGASGPVPGYERAAAPGFEPELPAAPGNNPLPMPVRWLYVLEDGKMAIPESVAADGKVTFTPDGAQPSAANPVVGRLAFWADDETAKLNLNTAGYARNDDAYWTYWDTPIVHTQEETRWLSDSQPWTAEYQRYPGHPATTGLNVVFESLHPGADQILALTPRYRHGGSSGGTLRNGTPPTPADIGALRKDERLFATVDEMFYNPARGANSAGISREALEARRFLLTTRSRAPETTLWGTPRVTLWPTWQTLAKRTPVDRLIAFCSTLAGQAFYFIRENPLSGDELTGMEQNLALWNYLRALSARTVPGFGGSFEAKYGTATRDQFLTSFYDAIRLVNLDDRSGPEAGEATGWSFTAGALRWKDGAWGPKSGNFTGGYVAPATGPNATRAPGRASTLAEVAILLARTSADPAEVQKVKTLMLYGFFTPSAGFAHPGQRRRIRVSGLAALGVREAGTTAPFQPLFGWDTYERTEIDPMNATRRYLGGRMEWTASRVQPDGTYNVPLTGEVTLPYDASDSSLHPVEFSGGTVTIEVYTPETAATPFQTYEVTFPTAEALTPEPVTSAADTWNLSGRWATSHYEERLSTLGDTVLAMQSPTGDYRSEVLRAGPLTDFKPHRRYGQTDLLTLPGFTATQSRQLSRRASSLRWIWSRNATPNPTAHDLFFGRLIKGFNGYHLLVAPVVPSHVSSVEEAFPPGDFSNGPGMVPDGSLSPKSDEGASLAQVSPGRSPYFSNFQQGVELAEGTLASPNRQVSSAVFLGSIPAGQPWRTLLFRPARAFHSGGVAHPGADSPPDYLLLDWFQMPVVEPYAISEPLSTAGKINLNTHIMPFGSYLRRETALHGLLRSARIIGIPEALTGEANHAGVVMAGITPPSSDAPDYATRYPLNVEETLLALRERAAGTDGSGRRVFLTGAEIASLDLVPEGYTRATLASFWADKRTTGDNSREAPYGTLLPRLTARSNTFSVHTTAEALQTREPDGGWREGAGTVAAQWRGSFGVERYIDPNDPRLTTDPPPDFLSGTVSVEPYHRFRILGERRFSP